MRKRQRDPTITISLLGSHLCNHIGLRIDGLFISQPPPFYSTELDSLSLLIQLISTKVTLELPAHNLAILCT